MDAKKDIAEETLELLKRTKETFNCNELACKKISLLKSIMDSPNGVIMFALDRAYRYTEFTHSHKLTIKKIWGVEIEVGMNMLDVIGDPADREKAKRNFDFTLQGNHLILTEEYGSDSLLRTYYEDRYSPIFDLSGSVSGLSVFVFDITERKRGEIALQETMLFRREAEKIGRIGAWKVNPRTDYLYWTEGVYNIVESQLDYMPGLEEGMKLYDAESIPILRDAVKCALKDGTPFVVEAGLVTMKGVHLWVEVRGLGRLNEGGQAFVMGTIQDITERKKAEKEKAHLESQLRQSQKMEAVGQLTGGISHDFNNLLTVINGYSQLLLMNPDLPDNIRHSIEAIDQAGEQAAGLTRQLLMFSRHHPIEPKVINLNSIVSGMEKMLHRLIRENVIITINIATILWQIKADAGSIEQVIMNLVVNASDAMPDGGRLTVEVENVKIDDPTGIGRLQITQGLYVMLSVSDTGCGMDDKVREHIFEPFFTTKEIGKGTGLGLATVYGIVKQSNAYIDVQSEPGKGAIFQIYFPKIENECATNEALQEVVSFPRGTETVLITEDEDNIRLMLKDFLQSIGYTVLTACNGKEALEFAESHKGQIHLLLTDIVMPGMNGFELAEQLKNSCPEIELLFMSGYAKPTNTYKMVDITDNLIDKPIVIHELAVKLRKILGK